MWFDAREEASLSTICPIKRISFSFIILSYSSVRSLSITKISFTNKKQLLHQSIRYIRFVPRNTTDTMKLSPTLCLVAAASFVAKADEVAILEDTPEARLIKDHDPIAEATYHESDPVVQDSVGSDNLPRLVRNRGPLTKKVVASASHFPGLDFSL